jgi:hypothetical protein
MPKVSTHTFLYGNATVNTDVFFGTMRDHSDYNLRGEKVFFIKLSEDAARHYGKSHIHANTFKDVTEKWEKAITKFMDAERSSKKVIAISVSSIMFEELAEKFGQGQINKDPNNRDYKNTASGRPRLKVHAYPNCRLDLSYHIGYIVTIGEKKFWSYYTDNEIKKLPFSYSPDSLDGGSSYGHDRNWGNYKFIDWTEEREVWIKNMYESFNRVIAQCRTFYNQNVKQIGAIMDNHINLLENSKPK